MNNSRRRQGAFTLVEVLVALSITAMIAMLSAQAFQTASSSAAATREAMERMAEIDRTFVLMENDLRNALPLTIPAEFGSPLPPLYVAVGDDYWMTVLRGGLANPLFQPRTEVVRIGYRYIDETIWRDTWYNPSYNSEDRARQRKLLEGVNSMTVRVLPPTAGSIEAGPWLDSWPQTQGGGNLPVAIEITLELADLGEIRRLFPLLPGTVTGGRGAPPPTDGSPN